MPKEDLEELSMEFANKFGSESLFKVFLEVAKGQNYVTKIAQSLRKSKAIVSRQVRELVQARLVKQWGEGVKQTLYVDWEVFTYYWITTFAPILAVTETVFSLIEDILETSQVPKWMGSLYLSKEEWKAIGGRKAPEKLLEEKLLPVIPNLAPIVEVLMKVGESEDFNGCFKSISTSFALGLPSLEEIEIEFDEIENEEKKQLFEALYSKPVQLWLKMLAFNDIYGANIVRNIVLEKIGLLKKK